MRLWRTGIVDPHTTLWRGCTASAASIGWPQSWGPPGRSKARCPTREHWRARPPSMRMRRGEGRADHHPGKGPHPLGGADLVLDSQPPRNPHSPNHKRGAPRIHTGPLLSGGARRSSWGARIGQRSFPGSVFFCTPYIYVGLWPISTWSPPTTRTTP